MDVSVMGRASAYVKGMELNMKWRERKQNPANAKEGEDPQIADIKRRAEDQRRSNAILSMQNKMMSGAKLTEEELDYLRENSPQDYEKAIKLEKERDEYKRELRQCRSKEDVQKLNMRKLQQFSAEAKNISGNPNISDAKKKELLDFICMRMKTVMSEHNEFVKAAEYQSLPDKNEEGVERSATFRADEDSLIRAGLTSMENPVSDGGRKSETQTVMDNNFTGLGGFDDSVKQYALPDISLKAHGGSRTVDAGIGAYTLLIEA